MGHGERRSEARERILDSAQRLVLEQGLAATSIDDVLTAAGTSKGAFFHHFPSKNALARAIVERYAEGDVAFLEEFMARAERESDDPAEQLLIFVRCFEDASEEMVADQPSCLYVSYIFDKQLFDDGTNDVIAEALLAYRSRLAAKIAAALEGTRRCSRSTRRRSPTTCSSRSKAPSCSRGRSATRP